jgi:nitric oxide reductase subunit C
MTKRQTRAFFYASTALFSLIFLVLTFDTHRQVGKLTNEDQLTPEVVAGKHVWHRKNCINCHTLLGEGAYYAPDLTKITQLRGEEYLKAFLKDPSRFYSEQQHRRLMPNPKLNEREITEVIAFLDWVSKIDNQGWPPRPILVTGAAIPGMAATPAGTAGPGDDPVARGSELFRRPVPGCFACHSTAPGVSLVGPTMAGISARATLAMRDPGYRGSSTTTEAYIRESILSPSAHIAPGGNYSSEGRSLMPSNFGEMLEPGEVDALVAYLSTLH